jgi:hypothetical protein
MKRLYDKMNNARKSSAERSKRYRERRKTNQDRQPSQPSHADRHITVQSNSNSNHTPKSPQGDRETELDFSTNGTNAQNIASKKGLTSYLPKSLTDDRIAEAWIDWIEHLTERAGKTPSHAILERQAKSLLQIGKEHAVQAIDFSIESGYKTLVVPRYNSNYNGVVDKIKEQLSEIEDELGRCSMPKLNRELEVIRMQKWNDLCARRDNLRLQLSSTKGTIGLS